MGDAAVRKLTSGEEELEDFTEAGGPGVFVVQAARNPEVAEVLAVAPAALAKAGVEKIAVAQVAQTFRGAHVQPDAQRGHGAGVVDEEEDAALVPPDTGGQHGKLSEDIRVMEAERERDQAAKRGSSEPGVHGVRQGAELGVDQRLELSREELSVLLAIAAAFAFG